RCEGGAGGARPELAREPGAAAGTARRLESPPGRPPIRGPLGGREDAAFLVEQAESDRIVVADGQARPAEDLPLARGFLPLSEAGLDLGLRDSGVGGSGGRKQGPAGSRNLGVKVLAQAG